MWLTWREAQALTHFQTTAAAVLGSTLIYLVFLIWSFLSPTCVHFLGGFLWQLLEHLLQDDGETNSAGRERMRGSDKIMSYKCHGETEAAKNLQQTQYMSIVCRKLFN